MSLKIDLEENYDGLLTFVKSHLPENDREIIVKSINYKNGWTVGVFYYPKNDAMGKILQLPDSIINAIESKLDGKGTVQNLKFPDVTSGAVYTATTINSSNKETIENSFY